MNNDMRRLRAVARETPWRREVVVSCVVVACIFGLVRPLKQSVYIIKYPSTHPEILI